MNHLFSKLSLPVLCALALLTACRKNTEEAPALITDTEAAEIVETAVATPSGGLTLATTESARTVASSPQVCGSTYDTTFQYDKIAGPYSYSRQSTLHWTIQCVNLAPQTALVTLTGTGDFTAANWNGDNDADGNLTIGGLAPQSTTYIAAGSYTRTGNLTGDLRRTDPSFRCVTTLTLTSVTLSKSDYRITGGSGTVAVTVTGSNGQIQSLQGALIFNGDGTATVTVNGHTHTFLLE